MNAHFIVPSVAALVIGVVVFPAFVSPKVVSKRPAPGYVAQVKAEDARITAALAALRRGDRSKTEAVRAVIRGLKPGDARRWSFAEALAQRGEIAAAYDLERSRTHFLESSVPDDAEMIFYAKLATATGHSDEAIWARERTGESGHFRVWRRGVEAMYPSEARAALERVGMYEQEINRTMDHGLELHPKFRDEIESLRQELLAKA